MQDAVDGCAQIAQILVARRQRTKRRLQLDRQQRGRQRLSCDVAEGHEVMARVDAEVIDQIAADVVGGACVQPHVPARDLRTMTWHERQLHRASTFELVARDQLVLQLQHQHDQQERTGEPRQADAHALGVEP